MSPTSCVRKALVTLANAVAVRDGETRGAVTQTRTPIFNVGSGIASCEACLSKALAFCKPETHRVVIEAWCCGNAAAASYSTSCLRF